MKRGISNMYLEDKNACCFLWQLLDLAIDVYGLDVKNIFLKYFLLSSSLFNGVGCNVNL